MKFEFLPHTADVKFRAWGETIEELFKNCANALFVVLSQKKVRSKKKMSIRAEGNDLEGLMYNFLEDFLFLLDSENFIPGKVEDIQLDKENFKIIAKVSGDDANPKDRDYGISHVKAITYNEMEITHLPKMWSARIVLDV